MFRCPFGSRSTFTKPSKQASYSYVRVMRSMSDGKSSVTIRTSTPICKRSCWMSAAILARVLLPELVTMVNSTRWPEESTSLFPCLRNPSSESRRSAATASYACGFKAWLNQKRLAGETGPADGAASDWKAILTRSSRWIDCETALRKFFERNQVFLYSGIGAALVWLNHICSDSNDG